MKTWQEVYSKYKDTELMKEFTDYLAEQPSYRKMYIGIFNDFIKSDIKDIWGYLLVFAETKGWELSIVTYDFGKSQPKSFVSVVAQQENDNTRARESIESAMLWCCSKFFECANLPNHRCVECDRELKDTNKMICDDCRIQI